MVGKMQNNNAIQYDNSQLAELKLGLDSGVDISVYATPDFLAIQMHQIRIGLEKHLDVSKYADVKFDWFQMEEIRKGLEANVDVDLYAKSEIDYKRMRQLRKGLEQGINLSAYIKLKPGILQELRKSILQKVEIVKYINNGYDVEQLRAIRHALVKNININPYLNPSIRGVAIEEITSALELGLNPDILCNEEYNWMQMREIRIGMQERLDYSIYSSPLYSFRQMREIRLGLEESLDVSKYKSFMFDYVTMHKKREELLVQKKEDFKKDIVSKNLPKGMHLELEEDAMKAYLCISFIEDVLPDKQTFIQMIKDNQITVGIDEDAIEQFLSGALTQSRILIASGQKPQKGKDGYYEYAFLSELDDIFSKMENGAIDYTTIKLNDPVKEGTNIATYHPATAGVDGYRVNGERIIAKPGHEQSALQGIGFYLSEDRQKYYASVDGTPELYEGCLNVIPLLELDDVTNVTGDVTFDGRIHIRGSVIGNVNVRATSDIIIDNMLLGAKLYSGRNILIRKGANGGMEMGMEMGRGFIECNGNLASGYIEAVTANAKGDVFSHCCMHADIFSDSEIYISDKVVGGSLNALSKIEVQDVGNDIGVVTKLVMRLNAKDENRIQTINQEMEEAKRQLEILTMSYEKYKEMYAVEVRNTMPVFLKIEDAIFTKQKDMVELKAEKDKIEEIKQKINHAVIYISGCVYEGTFVQIAEAKMEMQTNNNVKIRMYNNKIKLSS